MKNMRYRLGVVVVVVLTIAAALNMGCERCDRVNQEEGERLLKLYTPADTQAPTPLAEDNTATGAAEKDSRAQHMIVEAVAGEGRLTISFKAAEQADNEPQNYEDNDDHSLTGDEEVPVVPKKVLPEPKIKDMLVSIAVRPMVEAYMRQLVSALRRAEVCTKCDSAERVALTSGWHVARSLWFDDILDHMQRSKHLSERINLEGLQFDDEAMYEAWRKTVMEKARKYFANPNVVIDQYLRFKAEALATLKTELTAQQLQMVKALIASYAEIYFAEYEKIPQDLQDAAGSEEKSYELLNQAPSCSEEETKQLRAVRDTASAIIRGRIGSPEAFHFARRRYHEGGQPLLDAYAWCLKDLAAAIK